MRHVGPSIADAGIVVVAVHGRDQDAQFMIDHVVESIDDPSVAWLMPEAAGGYWWPGRVTDDLAASEPYFSAVMARMERFGSSLLATTTRPIVWLGFSQGACVVVEWAARTSHPVDGLVAFTGGRVGAPGSDLTVHRRLEGVPMVISGGRRDPWLPADRFDETVDAFTAAGAVVEALRFDDADHAIRNAETAAAAALFAEVVESPLFSMAAER